MMIWELREISEEEVKQRVRALQGRIIDLLKEPANLGPVRQFCRLAVEMGIYWKDYLEIMVREAARGTMPELYLKMEAEETKAAAKEAAKEARRQARKRKAA